MACYRLPCRSSLPQCCPRLHTISNRNTTMASSSTSGSPIPDAIHACIVCVWQVGRGKRNGVFMRCGAAPQGRVRHPGGSQALHAARRRPPAQSEESTVGTPALQPDPACGQGMCAPRTAVPTDGSKVAAPRNLLPARWQGSCQEGRSKLRFCTCALQHLCH